jgi:hypothetical protein
LVLVVAWLSFLMAGCHGGAQTDIAEREMRWQEDQIYAMEDYISEYQQLLCQYRAENSALKRQLACGQPTQQSGTQIKRDQQKIKDTQEIIHDVLPSEVPPLINTMPPPSGANQPPEFGPDLEYRRSRRLTPGIRRTALEERPEQSTEQLVRRPEQPRPAAEPLALDEAFEGEEAPEESCASPEPFQSVVVRGDVLPQNGEHGPRLLVEVEPLGASGGPAEFAGGLSLMVLDTNGEKPRGVARWDFSPEQLAKLVGEDAGPTMEFPLQLPAGTPIDQPLQIWARLVPTGAEKVLAHADVHLDQPGPFSSVRPHPVALRQQATPPVAEAAPDSATEKDQVVNDSVSLSTGDWDGWQVARPDQVDDTSPSRQAPESQWRKSTQPIPTSINYGRPIIASAEAKSAAEDRLARRTKATDAKPPTWSPQRDGDSTDKPTDVSAPIWSPER